MPEGQPANKGPGSRPQAPATVRANDGRRPRYRRAKATKRGGRDGGESERPGSTDEAAEPTRGTPWREGGCWGHGAAGGKDHGDADFRYGLYETSAIAGLAREDPKRAFLSLAHHIDLELLHEAFRRTRKDGATGVNGQTGSEYEERLEENLRSLLDRFKSGRYKAPPVRRTYVPKGDGSQTRPIGIPTFEDKVLQRAVVMVLEAVYEQDFLPCWYGYRPGRSAHHALQGSDGPGIISSACPFGAKPPLPNANGDERDEQLDDNLKRFARRARCLALWQDLARLRR